MPRRVTLVAWGSRGDVMPIVSLGQGLRAAGDEVTIVASRDFASVVRAAGLGYTAFDISVREAASSALGRSWLGGHRTLIGESRALQRVLEVFTAPLVDGLWKHTEEADLVVSGILTADACASLTAARNQQHAVALLTPVLPSRHGPSTPTAMLRRRESTVNTISGRAVLGASYHLLRVPGDEIRSRLGHPRTGPRWLLERLNAMPVLLGTSPLVVPPTPDQPTVSVTGYWPPFGPPHMDAAQQALAASVEGARARGVPVVYLGFGSMTSAHPAETADLLLAAARDAGVHALIGQGWAGWGDHVQPGEGVTVVDDIPHSWLFERCDAVVHHGGAGTTGSAIRAGTPQVVVAHMGDQPFWARRMHALGVAEPPLRRTGLTQRRLARALSEITVGRGANARRHAARELAAAVSAEHGVARATVALQR